MLNSIYRCGRRVGDGRSGNEEYDERLKDRNGVRRKLFRGRVGHALREGMP